MNVQISLPICTVWSLHLLFTDIFWNIQSIYMTMLRINKLQTKKLTTEVIFNKDRTEFSAPWIYSYVE